MRQVYCTLFCFLVLLIQTLSQSSDKQLIRKIDNLISEGYSSLAPGCAVLVAKKDKVIYEKAFGMANLELNVPLKPDMVFRIGSITKQYTAIAILKLIEEGKLSLKDSLRRFFPEFAYKGHIITIENLLTHTSGIIDYEVFDIHIKNAIRLDLPSTLLLDSLAPQPLLFRPGSKFAYSNSNYFLLGMLIEKITGKKYDTYLQDSILKPAGLLNTWYDSPVRIIPGRVNGYNKSDGDYNNTGYISMSQVFSAGALLSNVKDLFKWNKALRSFSIVTKETLDKAWENFRLSDSTLSGYGYGWFNSDFQGLKTIWHGGAIDGFRSMECYFPDQEIFLTVLINSENSEGFFKIIDNITKVIAEASGVNKEIIVPDTVLESYAGTYRWTEDTTQTISIYKKGNRLYADLSNKTGMNMVLVPQSSTLFYLPDVKRIRTSIEFIQENGEGRKLVWVQEKPHTAIRIK